MDGRPIVSLLDMRGITDDGISLRIVRGNAEVGVKEYFGEL